MYRHLVDPVLGMTGAMVAPRVLFETDVSIENVLDLRDAGRLPQLGLSDRDLFSEVEDYEACQRVGEEALTRGFSAVLALAATGLGETLAIFLDNVAPTDSIGKPHRLADWSGLPDDPRLERDFFENARCRTEEGPELFFSEDASVQRTAKEVCRSCPVRIPCLQHSYTLQAVSGIWGGLTVDERIALASTIPAPELFDSWDGEVLQIIKSLADTSHPGMTTLSGRGHLPSGGRVLELPVSTHAPKPAEMHDTSGGPAAEALLPDDDHQ